MSWPARKAVVPILVVLAAIAGAVYLVRSKPGVEKTDSGEQPWIVSAREVVLADIRPKLNLFGEIVAGREVELRALVSGEVRSVGDGFLEGGSIAMGDLIVAIDAFDYRANLDELSAQSREARARLDEIAARRRAYAAALKRDEELIALRRRDLKRMQELSRRGAVSEQRLDSARLELTQQEKTTEIRRNDLAAEAARIKQQQAVIARLGVGLRRAKRDLQRTRLTAPFAGYLVDVQAQIGKRLNVNDRVARLIDAGRLEAKVTLSDGQYGRLVTDGRIHGRPATVTWQVGGQSFLFPGNLDRVGARIDSASGGVDVFIRLNGAGLAKPLRPGAFVAVSTDDRNYRGVARLPESALYDGNAVYLIQDSRLQRRQVELVARVGNDVLVRGEIKGGDMALITRFAEAGPGQLVEIR
ncbi:MAG: efflux RND transporter periplasmic adaptor subunit [Alphaproteobacteria bacterium]|jgi:RND family efflux transporter MFP subunit|nr:efflux RND transporter periplasmic adaptor subunit [Alphaproteobacteria bacterium]MDP6567369.1 efflux RND transporter periplasmic adaptor subunit [Alphaproteobacteria bacterium]MDP6813051.1 efflux RND transporter periplasmic adaptor subunit [Alphaproteobacteria bacterium]